MCHEQRTTLLAKSEKPQYTLITDAAMGIAEMAGSLGAILTQKDQFDNFFAILYASCQLKDHKKIICHLYSSLPLLSGAWMYSTNISKAKKSSFIQTTSCWRKWDTYIQR